MSKSIDKDGAIRLLEAMCASSADDFRAAVATWVQTMQDERRIKNGIFRLVRELDDVYKKKSNAEYTIRQEYGFMMGEETVKPPIDGLYVMTTLLRGIMDEAGNADLILTYLNGDNAELVKTLYETGRGVRAIVKETGLSEKYVKETLKKGE